MLYPPEAGYADGVFNRAVKYPFILDFIIRYVKIHFGGNPGTPY